MTDSKPRGEATAADRLVQAIINRAILIRHPQRPDRIEIAIDVLRAIARRIIRSAEQGELIAALEGLLQERLNGVKLEDWNSPRIDAAKAALAKHAPPSPED